MIGGEPAILIAGGRINLDGCRFLIPLDTKIHQFRYVTELKVVVAADVIGSQLDTGAIYIDWRLIECCRYSFHDGGSSSGAGDQEDAQQQANDEIEFSLHTNHLIDSIPAPSMRMSAGFYR